MIFMTLLQNEVAYLYNPETAKSAQNYFKQLSGRDVKIQTKTEKTTLILSF